MNDQNTSSTALVTGASSGIGAAIASSLTRDGVRVICAGRSVDRLQAVADSIGPLACALPLDVTDQASVDSLFDRLAPEWRNIDVLVNNAGHDIGGKRRLEEGAMEQWESIISTNLTGLIRVTRAVVPAMVANDRGHIVNLGSVSGVMPVSGETLYCASKYGVHGFTETLRVDYSHTKIRITEVMPGMVRTNFAAARFEDEAQGEQYYADHGVCLLPEDVAETVAFAVRQPPRVVISQLAVVPVGQA